jgi:hypothetical protein
MLQHLGLTDHDLSRLKKLRLELELTLLERDLHTLWREIEGAAIGAF